MNAININFQDHFDFCDHFDDQQTIARGLSKVDSGVLEIEMK